MKRSARAVFLCGTVLVPVFGSCAVDIAGAPCETDDNCPAGQHCGAEGTCILGEADESDRGGAEGSDGGATGGDGGDTGVDGGEEDVGTVDGGVHDVGGDDGGRDGGDAGRDGGDGGRDGGDAGRDGGDGGADGGDAGGCKDECSPNGYRECTGAFTTRHCGDADLDGCLEWGPDTTCQYGCENGLCQSCQPDCAAKAKECGTDGCGGSCGDCSKAPPAQCLDTKSLRTYKPGGVCGGTTFKCVFQYSDERCLYQCAGGKCIDDSFARAFVSLVEDRYVSLSAGDAGAVFACGSTRGDPMAGRAGLLTKLDASGLVAWHRVVGGDADDDFFSVAATPDGGALVAGSTVSFGSEGLDGWVVKFKADGVVEWQFRYGGHNDDEFRAAATTGDGGYIVAGSTKSWGTGRGDFWVVKLKSNGAISWERVYGSTDDEAAAAITRTSDGGYAVAGYTASFGAGFKDAYVVKLATDGALGWQGAYGGAGDDYAARIVRTADSAYVVVGSTDSFAPQEGKAMFGFRVEASGALTWASTAGGAGDDEAFSAALAPDQGVVVAGSTQSFGAGSGDAWVLRLKPDGQLLGQRTYGRAGVDRVFDIVVLPAGDAVLAGESTSFGNGGVDPWLMRLNPDGSIGPECPSGFTADSSAGLLKPSVTVTAGTGVAGTSFATPVATNALSDNFVTIAANPCAAVP